MDEGPHDAPVRAADPWRTATATLSHLCALLGGLGLIVVVAILLFLVEYDYSTGGGARRDPIWLAGSVLMLLTQVVALVAGARGAAMTSHGRPTGPWVAALAGLVVATEGAWFTIRVDGMRFVGGLLFLCGAGTAVAAAVVARAARSTRP